MRTVGVYLIFAAVVVRTAVVLSNRPALPVVIALLTAYGLLLMGKIRLPRATSLPHLQSRVSQLAYLILQSVLVITALVISSYEDFLAMLFIPLSLDAVAFFGRRIGTLLIGLFSLAMIVTLLFSDVGPLFGLAMGILYSGICFLFGGYAHQVRRAEAAHKQNEQVLNELQTAYRQLEGYADQLASLGMEHERNRLARELHDSVTQTVFSMNLAAQSAHLLLAKEPSRAAGQLLRIEELAASALCEIQALVLQLKPRAIMEEGLPAALSQLAAELKARDNLQVILEIHGDGVISEPVAAGLYSIAHEALINVSRHSGQCQAIIRLHMDKERAWMEIEDHGQGFDPDIAFHRRGHLGLMGMFERAREIGWDLSVHSQPMQGTRIRVTEDLVGARHETN